MKNFDINRVVGIEAGYDIADFGTLVVKHQKYLAASTDITFVITITLIIV